MLRNNKRKPAIAKTTKVTCRRTMVERRVTNAATLFPIIDGNGAKVNKDRRWRPDRRYDVEIQWLRG